MIADGKKHPYCVFNLYHDVKYLAVFLFLLPAFFAGAQLPQYHAQVFGPEQGIGGGGISDLFKDRGQFLWVVNATTMQRFDGRNVRTYAFEKSISHAICSRENQIWALSGRKLWRLEAGIDRFAEMPFDTAGGILPAAIFQLQDRSVWVLTNKGVFAWQEQQHRFERLPLQPPPPISATNLWRFDTWENTIFYPGKKCLFAYDVSTDRVQSLPVAGEIPYMQALSGALVALSQYDGQTCWYDFSKEKITPIDTRQYGITAQKSAFGITGAAPLGNGRYLITSRIGTFHYDLPSDRFTREYIYAAGKPLELEDMLARVFVDENGTLWAHNTHNIAAFESLDKTLGLLRNYHYQVPGKWSNRVAGFTEDADANLWFCGGNGFTKLDLKTGTTHPFLAETGATDRLSHNSVRGLGFDGKYLILGPTDKGIWLFDPRTERYRRPVYASDSVKRASEGDFIDHLLVLRNGDIVVAGRFHPYRIETGSYRLDFISFPGDKSNTNAVFQDEEAGIRIGTGNGIYRLDANYRFQSSVRLPPVVCMARENDKSLLAGTGEGLFRIQGDSIESIPVSGKAALTTFLFRDRLQRWWVGTTDGLYLGDRELKVFRKFDFADNIQGLVFNANACFRASNDLVFFSGINGINYLHPEKISMQDRPLSVSIRSLRINDNDSTQGIQPGQHRVFLYSENTLGFDVVAPYFNNAGKVQYRYRLAGVSGQWVNLSGGTRIRLANLAPGTYQLEVAASTNGETWYPAPQALIFTILPPFWHTWPFRAGMLLVFGLLLWSLIRFRENRLKKRQAEQLEVEKLKNTALQYQVALAQTEEARQRALLEAIDNQRKAAEAKLQSMRLQMNPHFLFNALNSIQQMTMSGKGDSAALYLSKFSRLLRMILTHSDLEELSLREEIEMLRLYLDLESLRFDGTFEYEIVSETGLDLDEYRVPPLLIQPFVENAIWHGLLHKEGQRMLRISFSVIGDDVLECAVEDNGVGRDAARRHNRHGHHTGKGMSVGAERIRLLNQQNNERNTLKIIDLYKRGGAPAGTRVVIRLY